MPADVARLARNLVERAAHYGIEVRHKKLDTAVPGEFDGPTITLNSQYDATESTFYLAHSIGSIAAWSIDPHGTGEVFRTLQQAKKSKSADPGRLQQALDAYLAFESRTWEFATWLLGDLGHADVAPAFSNFGRADMESMRIFHSTGKAPVWRDFFTAWNEEVRQGKRTVSPFSRREIPPFRAVTIPKQQIVQEDDGEG